jgi:hypothetical protein
MDKKFYDISTWIDPLAKLLKMDGQTVQPGEN